MKLKDAPAFAAMALNNHGRYVDQEGMTLHQFYAGLAMQGIIAANDHCNPTWHTEDLAKTAASSAILYASALIAELEKVEL
jgi:predicted lipoprotein with Yx(FWY)xxD motif